MSSEHVTSNGLNSDANPAASNEFGVRRRAIVAADVNEVMREQLEYLIEHAGSGNCECLQCDRYVRARSVLMEIFSDSDKRSPAINPVSGEAPADTGS